MGDCCTDATCSTRNDPADPARCYLFNVPISSCQTPAFPLPYFNKYLNGVDATGGQMCVQVETDELLGACCMTDTCAPPTTCYPLQTVSSCRTMVAAGENLPYFRDIYGGNACNLLADYGSCCSTSDCNPDTCKGGLLPNMCEKKGMPYFLNADGTVCLSMKAGGEADPHIERWNGQWFDYQGECDLVMAKVPDFLPNLPLDLHIRTRLRYEYSYITAAALRIGTDVLEVASWGDYAMNGVDGAAVNHLTMSSHKFRVYHRQPQRNHTILDIVLSADSNSNITMGSYKDMVFVRITDGTRQQFGSAQGLMGNFAGQMLARNGVTDFSSLDDVNAFGQEWQVRPDEDVPDIDYVQGGQQRTLFRSVGTGPQYPHQRCRLPTPKQQQQQRLKGFHNKPPSAATAAITRDQAVTACAHWVDPVRKKGCVSDVLVTGDIQVANAV